jgi:hypothetical protein
VKRHRRLALFYAALVLVFGIYVPFAPSYLATKGLGPGQIGLLLGAIQRLLGKRCSQATSLSGDVVG